VDFDGDGGGMEERVVDQALVDGAVDAFDVLGIEAGGDFDSDVEIVEAGRGGAFVGGDADFGALGGKVVLAQVGGGVKGGAGAEGSEEEFGRGHAFVEAAVFGGLVAGDGVLAGFDFELNGSEMLDLDFDHKWPPPSQLIIR